MQKRRAARSLLIGNMITWPCISERLCIGGGGAGGRGRCL